MNSTGSNATVTTIDTIIQDIFEGYKYVCFMVNIPCLFNWSILALSMTGLPLLLQVSNLEFRDVDKL